MPFVVSQESRSCFALVFPLELFLAPCSMRFAQQNPQHQEWGGKGAGISLGSAPNSRSRILGSGSIPTNPSCVRDFSTLNLDFFFFFLALRETGIQGIFFSYFQSVRMPRKVLEWQENGNKSSLCLNVFLKLSRKGK